MLIVIDQLLEPDQLVSARALLSQARWEHGQVSAGTQAAQVKDNQQVSEAAPQLAPLRQLVLEALARSARFFSAALPLRIAPPQFNRYGGAHKHYGRHVDSALRSAPPGYLRADVSATLFLNEPQDYDGGQLRIDDTFGRHDIKLPAGSLVVYPSSSVHSVEPVTRGQRLACFLFVQSLVRQAEQRRLLHDMDMALLELRSQCGEIDPVVRLTGTYHNLLRVWAETS